MGACKFVFVIICAALCLTGHAAEKRKLKILISSPSIGWSHMQLQGAVADALVEAGHQVHILTMNMNPLNGDYKSSKLAHRVTKVDRKDASKAEFSKIDIVQNPFAGYKNMMFDGAMKTFNKLFCDFCEELLNNTQLLNELEAEHYDVGISEIFDYCLFGVFHKIGVKTKVANYAIPLVNIAGYQFGIPTFSSYVTNLWAPSLNGPNMNFVERANNFFMDMYEQNSVEPYAYNINQPIFQAAFGSDFPSLRDIVKNVSLLFINSNPFYDFPKPISNKVIYIGGIVESKNKPLTQEFQTIFQNTKSGVVLLSFGTFADSALMPDIIKKAFFQAFAHFSTYDFIWKLDVNANDTEALKNAPNVHAYKWTDQKAILAHPKTKAFITHCGANSMSESTLNGVPMLGIPLLGDQFYNGALMHYKQIGVHLDILKTHQSQVIIDGLNKVLNDPIYKQNVKLLQKKIQLNPFPPKEQLVKWVEFAAEFPELNELNLPSIEDFGYMKYYCLDVIAAGFYCARAGLVDYILDGQTSSKQISQAIGSRNQVKEQKRIML